MFPVECLSNFLVAVQKATPNDTPDLMNRLLEPLLKELNEQMEADTCNPVRIQKIVTTLKLGTNSAQINQYYSKALAYLVANFKPEGSNNNAPTIQTVTTSPNTTTTSRSQSTIITTQPTTGNTNRSNRQSSSSSLVGNSTTTSGSRQQSPPPLPTRRPTIQIQPPTLRTQRNESVRELEENVMQLSISNSNAQVDSMVPLQVESQPTFLANNSNATTTTSNSNARGGSILNKIKLFEEGKLKKETEKSWDGHTNRDPLATITNACAYFDMSLQDLELLKNMQPLAKRECEKKREKYQLVAQRAAQIIDDWLISLTSLKLIVNDSQPQDNEKGMKKSEEAAVHLNVILDWCGLGEKTNPLRWYVMGKILADKIFAGRKIYIRCDGCAALTFYLLHANGLQAALGIMEQGSAMTRGHWFVMAGNSACLGPTGTQQNTFNSASIVVDLWGAAVTGRKSTVAFPPAFIGMMQSRLTLRCVV